MMQNKRMVLALLSIILTVALALASGCQLVSKAQRESSGSASPVTEAGQTTTAISQISTTWEPPETITPSLTLPGIADVVARVRPSVVAINTIVRATDIFGRAYNQEGAGSGWIISSDGLIITNNHVVEGATSITVTLESGEVLTVQTVNVATDAFTDLAVLKVNTKGLPAVKVGDSSKLRVGDWVVAIGNSLGQGIRATQGIVSRKDVKLSVSSDQEVYGLIETDAAINPGNSGGPLVNMAGEVIGITSIKISTVGVEGTGYAISSNEAMPIIQDLINKGYVSRAYLGVSTYTVDNYAIARFALKVDKGVLLTYVEQGSPAAMAGLQAGDVVVKFNGRDVLTGSELVRSIHQSKIGAEVEITYWRDANQATTKVTLIEKQR